MREGGIPFTVLSVSLSPSPPFSVSRQARRGLIATDKTRHKKYLLDFIFTLYAKNRLFDEKYLKIAFS
jgi:hypothetical protein